MGILTSLSKSLVVFRLQKRSSLYRYWHVGDGSAHQILDFGTLNRIRSIASPRLLHGARMWSEKERGHERRTVR